MKELNFDALIKENITAQENKNFDKTIRQFKYNLRKNPPTYDVHKKSKPLVLPPPKIHPISTPVPKSMPLFRKHNMNLRKRRTYQGLPLQNISIEPPTYKNLVNKPFKNFRYAIDKLLLNQHETSINHIYNENGLKMSVDSLLKEKPDIWRQSVSNELGRLAQGV